MLGQKIKSLRLSNNLTLEELATKLNSKYPDTINFNKGKLSKWENNKEEPKLSSVRLLADFYGIGIDDLYDDGQSKQSRDNSIENIYKQLSPSRQTKVYDFATHQLNEQTKYKNNDKIVSIKEFKTHEVELAGKVSAGGGTYNDKNFIETVEVESMPSHYDLAFQVSGDSMYPTFEDGEIIFVKETCDVYNGQIGVVEINKEAYVKKMYLEGKRLRLVSLNCDNKEDGSRLYPDFYADDHDELFIIGRVIL